MPTTQKSQDIAYVFHILSFVFFLFCFLTHLKNGSEYNSSDSAIY